METIKTQVCIIGAGAGGIGCAYRLIKSGIRTVIVDKNGDYGGTMTFGGIDGWEPGVSLEGIHQLIRDELSRMPNGCHIVERVPCTELLGAAGKNVDPDTCPWGYDAPGDGNYEDTLARCLSLRGKKLKRFQFDGDCFIRAVRNIFSPYAMQLTELFGYRYCACEKSSDRITAVHVTNGTDHISILADVFVDASGDIVLARDAGCAYAFGCEGPEEYGEPSALADSSAVNAVTYAFRVTKASDPCHIDSIPPEAKAVELGPWVHSAMKSCVSLCVRYPDGDLHFNMLPTMQGAEYFALGEQADSIGRARVYAYWHYLQTEKGLCGYTLKRLYAAGVRESYRLKGRYVLREQDIRLGLPGQPTAGRTVAIADHAMDIHGSGGMCNELEAPYAIPLECTRTREFENLFVACRGASFTHLAASSARLSRTMLSLGEGIGEYIAEQLSHA